MEGTLSKACTDGLKEDQAEAWALVEARHLVLVLVCWEGWQSEA